MSPLLLASGAVSLLCSAAALVLLRSIQAQDRFNDRVEDVQRAAGLERKLRRRSGGGPLQMVTALGAAVARSGLLSDKTVTELQHTLSAAGFRGSTGMGLFVGSKVLLVFALPALAWLALGQADVSLLAQEGGTACAAVMGLLAPDTVVKSLRARSLKRLQKGLPDALDMMVICSEAGLSLEPSISRVAAEIAASHPAVAAELSLTANELRILSDRRTAILNMGNRTGLENLKRLGATLVQTMQYGTPLAQALRTLSAEMRTEMLTRFEERAARLPVLLTVPMIVFILPTVFAVVGGPAMLHVMASLHH